MQRIYLDNAATSWPKPESVLAAMDDYHRRLGAPAGRGIYREAVEVERAIAEARRRVAELLGIGQQQRILLTAGCTDSLNLALHGILRPGDHVITTVTEHNSVLRPLRYLEVHRNITVTLVPCGADGVVDAEEVRRAILPHTRLVVLNHVSNVTGAIQPAEAIGRIAAEHGLLFLLDAAQSLGHLNFNVADINAHLIAAPGHKGLLGPLGVGLLYVANPLEEMLEPLRQGGTGTHSIDDRQPELLPDKYESGTHNVPGIVGLSAGVAHLQKTGLAAIRRSQRGLTERLLNGLREIAGVRVYGPGDADRQLGVVSLAIQGFDPHEAAAALDSAYHIQTRPGLQCAPRMHEALGTQKSGGTLRISLGSFTTEGEIDAAVRAIGEIAASAVG
ncbi:MAG TPA: aminotransferase class V-fold PLP-dependent enzyme [Pirellulaceae bacterium]|nr:aminotransferase class V-fold PLP-dependent enzyme [Pirellulaceae bacterium]